MTIIYRITSLKELQQKLKGSALVVYLVTDTPIPFMTHINAHCSLHVLGHQIPS